MVLQVFSASHILILLITAGIIFAIYYPLRHAAEATKRNVIILLMALNILQHFFKHYIYPHIPANGLQLDNTACNICAFLILASPFMHLCKSRSARQYIAYVGTISGAVAILVPFWFFGRDIFAADVIWEFIRFYSCHALLFTTSLLPVLWGRVRFCHGDGWKFGLYFLGMLCVLLLNNTIFLLMIDKTAAGNLYERLLSANAGGFMGPPAYDSPYSVLVKIAEALSPAIFLGGAEGVYTPILWYMTPIYFLMTPVAYGLATLWQILKKKFYICSILGPTDLKKSKKYRYFERRNLKCKIS